MYKGSHFFHIPDNLLSLGFLIIASLKCSEGDNSMGKEKSLQQMELKQDMQMQKNETELLSYITQNPIQNGLTEI